MPPLKGTNPAKQCKKLVLPLPLLPLITNKSPENNLKDIGLNKLEKSLVHSYSLTSNKSFFFI